MNSSIRRHGAEISLQRVSLTLFIALLAAPGCASLLGVEDLDETDAGSETPDAAPGADAAPLEGCRAQRTIHVVGGTGGLAWFTLEWPNPEMIATFDPTTSAFDDLSLAVDLSGRQPLFARRLKPSMAALWQGTGVAPQPSAFWIGTNEVHTSAPTSAITLDGDSVVAQGAAAQSIAFSPLITVLAFGVAPYGTALASPAATRVDEIEDAISALRDQGLSAEDEDEIRPDPSIIATWTSSTDPRVIELAEYLLFTANLFARNLAATVVIPAFGDDPHGAFSDVAGIATPRADALANVLHGFYAELAKSPEPTCTLDGAPVSLADNVVLLASGDTPKNSFQRGGWPDGTTLNANVLYVRSNGWLVPGFFGSLTSTTKTNFNPTSGALDPIASTASNQAAALAAVLYAITRGDNAYVDLFDLQTFDGLIETTSP